VVKEINQPRLPSLKGKMASKKAVIVKWTAADLGADRAKLGLDGSPTKVVRIFTPQPRGGGEVFKGEPEVMVPQLVEKLRGLVVGSAS
jgi:electron transfer flavoprotein beta subunit